MLLPNLSASFTEAPFYNKSASRKCAFSILFLHRLLCIMQVPCRTLSSSGNEPLIVLACNGIIFTCSFPACRLHSLKLPSTTSKQVGNVPFSIPPQAILHDTRTLSNFVVFRKQTVNCNWVIRTCSSPTGVSLPSQTAKSFCDGGNGLLQEMTDC